ncbi:MAG: hypothetical protein AABY40_03035 [Nanoarchaeota archaeon]
MRYQFTPDTQAILDQKGDVEFLIGLYRDADPNTARSKLESLTTEIGYANYIHAARALVCVTNQAAYETIFQAVLERCPAEKRRIDVKYTNAGYRELKSATIPSELCDLVYAIHLNLSNKK